MSAADVGFIPSCLRYIPNAMRPHAGWISPRWIRARFAYWRFHAAALRPHLSLPCIAFLEQWLRLTDRVLEYGSGSSTPWLADRVEHVISVENDHQWADRVAAWTSSNKNVQLKLFAGTHHDPAYIGYLDTLDVQFDLILDDGWQRAAVARAAVDLLAPGGLLIIDDHSIDELRTIAEMRSFFDATKEWRSVTWRDGMQTTSGFFKGG